MTAKAQAKRSVLECKGMCLINVEVQEREKVGLKDYK